MNNVKNELMALANRMSADATWDDVIYQLYVEGKVSLGLAQNERDAVMSREMFDNLFIRAESAHNMPADMRNTLIYNPGNTTTVAMVAGVVAAVFAFVFPPISWLAAPIAFVAGFMGVLAGQSRAWVAMMLSFVTLIPFVPMVLK